MRVLIAGASGAVGRSLIPMLAEAGHSVIPTARSQPAHDGLENVEWVSMDLLDPVRVCDVVVRARPDAIIHQATSLPHVFDFRKFDRVFRTTDALRSIGLDNLVRAAEQANVRRIVAQSYTGWNNDRRSPGLQTEDAPLDASPLPAFRRSLAVLNGLERRLAELNGIAGIALRYGALYGPGTGFDRNGDITQAVRSRKLPLVGSGNGVWSFTHVKDAAAAAVAALDAPVSGTFNIVDDEPAPVREWLPHLAQVIGAKPPLRVPTALARLFIGRAGVMMMTELRGASNAKAKALLGWRPLYPSWRQGFQELAGVTARH